MDHLKIVTIGTNFDFSYKSVEWVGRPALNLVNKVAVHPVRLLLLQKTFLRKLRIPHRSLAHRIGEGTLPHSIRQDQIQCRR